MNRKIIVANWKMNPQTLDEASRLLDGIAQGFKDADSKKLELVLAPPFPYLYESKKRLPRGIGLAAQDVSFSERGAYTGEVSALMVKNAGCDYAIIGHSERRWKMGETDETINLKIKQALAAGLKPILAVGEKEEGADLTQIIGTQLAKALDGVASLEDIMIVYEPVWAIGTGKPDTPDGALSAALLIRKIVGNIYDNYQSENLSVLYGGSVNADNVKSFVFQNGINGALVGGASIVAQDFTKIIKLILNM
ncbi:triose-phosphate isomerase [Candidatus Azambacteria bacterium RIFCSPHIGHO2_02_FULL_45_18]|nr:MAG: triose-phosphate isomerase [Candidatus Azambacteria bacterium RIFCSPHIGHO2_02_FULL_45_18]